ncbi:MAG: hypothetical protein WCQ21_06225 [Verrucomicrobiota bacterium]|jgi:hypothetical protein
MKTHNIVITTDQKQALAKNNPWPIVAAIGWRRLCKRESLPTKRTQQLLVRQLAASEVEKLHTLCGEAYKQIDQAVINSALDLGQESRRFPIYGSAFSGEAFQFRAGRTINFGRLR